MMLPRKVKNRYMKHLYQHAQKLPEARAQDVADALLEDLESKLPVLMKQFPEFTQYDIADLANGADPTPQKKYITWLLRMSRKQRIWRNDFASVASALRSYDWQRNRDDFEGERDINRYKTLAELFAVAQKHNPQRTLGIDKEPVLCRGPLCVFKFEKGEERLLMRCSAPVEWCTKEMQHAARYLKAGPVYLVTKNNERYVLATHKGDHIHNIHDAPISKKMALEVAPLFYDLGLVKPGLEPYYDAEKEWTRREPGFRSELLTQFPDIRPGEIEANLVYLRQRFFLERPSGQTAYSMMYDLGHAAGLF